MKYRWRRTCLLVGIAMAAVGLARADAAPATTTGGNDQPVMVADATTPDNVDARLKAIESQLQDLQKVKTELEQLKSDMSKQTKPSVVAKSKGQIVIDGRIFVDAVKEQSGGTNGGNAVIQVPDARLRLTYEPSDNVDVVSRLRLGGGGLVAGKTGVDYLYMDLKHLSKTSDVSLRLGNQKTFVGEETYTDNQEESLLVNNSVAIVGGYNTGVALMGSIPGAANSLHYAIGAFNVDKTFNASTKIGFAGKVFGNLDPAKKWYASGSVYFTGENPATTATALSVGGLSAAPAGATSWKRTVWEGDLTYGYHGGDFPYGGAGKKGAVGGRIAYGQVKDTAIGGGGDLDGKYWHVEGFVNATPDLYFAARYSGLKFDNGATAKVDGVTANDTKWLQVGFGYRITPLTLAKVEYIKRDEKPTDTPNDGFTVGVATKF